MSNQTVVAKPLYCLPDFEELIANHERGRPFFVLWSEGREIMQDPIPSIYAQFSLTAVSPHRVTPACDWDECVFVKLGHYKVVPTSMLPLDAAEAQRVEARARSAKEAVEGYLTSLGYKVRAGRPAMVEGLKLVEGDAEFLLYDEGKGLYYFEDKAAPKAARKGRRP